MEESLIERLAHTSDPIHGMHDLGMVVIWLFSTVVCIFVPPLNESFIRVLFALPMILFIPGYVVIAVLFPKRGDLDLIERLALSFGLSIAIVPLIGLALNYTPWGIRLVPIVLSLVLFTTAMVVGAWVRRAVVAPDERFRIPFTEMLVVTKETLFAHTTSRLDRVLSGVLLLSIIVAIVTTVYVIVVPKEGEKFTEFYILGEKGRAADYPRDIVTGREYSVIIGVGNHEYRNISYTVECHLVNETFDPATNTSILYTMARLDRFSLSVPYNTTVEQRWNFSVEERGYNRLEFLLFNETVPDDTIHGQDRINASYRDLHLWIEVLPSR